MRRQRYGQNSTVATSGRVGNLIPIAMTEVVPGDTISGSIEANLMSDVCVGFCTNRAYFDVFTFYIPYRLLWSGFPDFIIKGTGTLPLVTNLFHAAFEQQFTTTAVANEHTKLVPWSRRAYNAIYNEFFKLDDTTAAGTDDNVVLPTNYRPSTFHQSEPAMSPVANVAASLGVDDIREAFAKDQFDKTREYYGDKYIDYLRAMGVTPSWSILEKPEVLAKSNQAAAYKLTDSSNQSATVDLSQIAGYWTGKTENRISKKFIPEHGLIYSVAVMRIDMYSLESTHPVSANTLPEHYWSPEYDVIKERAYPNSLWLDVATAVENVTNLPNWEHLRKGTTLGLHGRQTAENQGYSWNQNFATVAAYTSVIPGEWANAFQMQIGDEPDSDSLAQFAIQANNRLVKQSPVGTRTQAPLR